MKKGLVMSVLMAAAFVAVFAGAYANKGHEGMMDEGKMAMMKADVKAVNTAEGVNIVFTAKDAKDVKEIQEAAARMIEMHKKMQKDKDGMWMHGMGMDNPMKMHTMQKKMGVIFGFLCVIWSLLIILLIVTIILVIKKIAEK